FDFYKNGPSFMQRPLPLWLSVHAQRAIAVLVTAIALGLPMFRLTPVIYQWFMRRRLIYWYGKLTELEFSFDGDPSGKHLPQGQIEQLERIEDAVSHISLPLNFADQLYNLRSRAQMHRDQWRLNNRMSAKGHKQTFSEVARCPLRANSGHFVLGSDQLPPTVPSILVSVLPLAPRRGWESG